MSAESSEPEGTGRTAEQGLFIVLEGIDGSGTTTQAQLLQARFSDLGREVCLTREPSRGPVGRFLRQALTGQLRNEAGVKEELDWSSMALLFSADRLDHLAREILPALNAHQVVVCDRYDLSSLVYQSATSPLGLGARPWLRAQNARAVRPDLTLVLDVDASVAEQRRAARGQAAEIFEESGLQRILRDFYRRPGDFLPDDRIQVLSGEGTLEEVSARIWEAVQACPEFGRMVPGSR